jgi:hypothetical protein
MPQSKSAIVELVLHYVELPSHYRHPAGASKNLTELVNSWDSIPPLPIAIGLCAQ